MVRIPCTCTIRQQAKSRSYGTEDTFWRLNQFPSTRIPILLLANSNKTKSYITSTSCLIFVLPSLNALWKKPARTYRFAH
jgi:hypothetical protein